MRSETELRRLAAARPARLDHSQDVVSPAEQERMLLQILDDRRGQETPGRAAGWRTLPSRRLGRRTAVRTSVAAASVAAAVAAAALAVSSHRAPGVYGPPEVVRLDAKIVLARSIRALGHLGDAVEYSHITGSLNGQPYSSDLWVYRAAERQFLTGPGQSATEGWQAITGRTLTKGFIFFDRKTWTRYSSPADPGWLEVSRTPTAKLEAGFLTYIIGSGRWAVTGHTVVDGQKALVVRATEKFPGTPRSAPRPASGNGATRVRRNLRAVPEGPLIDIAPSLTTAQYERAVAHGQTTFTSTGTVTRTLYISAKTYLPIMETDVTHLTSQGVPDSAATQTETSTFQWLPVTPVTLALLKPPAIPAGYTRVNPNGH